ncbi:YafY family protein [Lentzea sp. NBRC 105346]|uniref:helix-turn-helix transcriptional regulator n=1 Tax=Lentzea sp. NBRC 105346 TaxID=3032205 RepID=UPI0025558376|nr:YafY family protein [Lentzea sp. NBRC 105346]
MCQVKASRLLSVLLLLQSRGRMTAQELADELEVSVRTIYRDAEALSAAGVPVYADRGPAGGYQLLDGYRTRLTGLTSEEAESLFLAGMPGPAAELGLGTVVAAAQLKLMAALPPELRSRASRIRERFHLDTPSWFRGQDTPPHLGVIAEAVWNQRRLHLRYQRWGGSAIEVERDIEPLGLVLKAGVWYFVGGPEPRTYRVSRVLELRELDETFERPEDFDLSAFWTAWSERFESTLYGARVRVRMSAEGLRKSGYLLTGHQRRVIQELDPKPGEEFGFPTESLRHAHSDLLRLGADVEVVAPAELREQMMATISAMQSVYGDGKLRAWE